MKKTIYHIVRIFLALVFIFSGLVKMIDPVGTQIKLEEYFSPAVLNLPFLTPYALAIGIFLILLEWTLGWSLLFNIKPRLTLKLTLALTLFFLTLTGYSAATGTVTDCGCFGDAVKLTPWQTFFKNVVLLILLLITYALKPEKQSASKPTFWITGAAALLALFLMLYTVNHLPLIDFRPYAAGKNIREGMTVPEGAPAPEFKNIWYYKINGEIKRFTDQEKPWEIEGAEFVKRETKMIKEGYVPPIHDFSIEGDWGDITDKVLDAPKIYLILIPEPYDLTEQDLKNLFNAVHYFKKHHLEFVITASDISPALERWSRAVNTPLNVTDETTLKTMIRTSPGIMLLEKATVKGKWTLKDFLKKHPSK